MMADWDTHAGNGKTNPGGNQGMNVPGGHSTRTPAFAFW